MNNTKLHTATTRKSVVALCGGVGGAKLAMGLNAILGSGLKVIVNTGDDFEHLGLNISPDLDSVLYAMAGINDVSRGWGRDQETWFFMESLKVLGGETWFQIGDKDLALHIERTRRMRTGVKLSRVTADLAKQLGISCSILPMSDDPVRTFIQTNEGLLSFQKYFVMRKCEPISSGINYQGAESAKPLGAAISALTDPNLDAIIICPSNPYLSIDPILSIPLYRNALLNSLAPIIVISPIIAGKTIKGPADKLMIEKGLSPNSIEIYKHYQSLNIRIVIDKVDFALKKFIDAPVLCTNTVMNSLTDSMRLAEECLDFALTESSEAITRQ